MGVRLAYTSGHSWLVYDSESGLPVGNVAVGLNAISADFKRALIKQNDGFQVRDITTGDAISPDGLWVLTNWRRESGRKLRPACFQTGIVSHTRKYPRSQLLAAPHPYVSSPGPVDLGFDVLTPNC